MNYFSAENILTAPYRITRVPAIRHQHELMIFGKGCVPVVDRRTNQLSGPGNGPRGMQSSHQDGRLVTHDSSVAPFLPRSYASGLVGAPSVCNSRISGGMAVRAFEALDRATILIPTRL